MKSKLTTVGQMPEPDRPTRGNKISNWVAVVALAVIAIGIGIFMSWSFQDEKVLDVKNQPFPARTIREHPTAGGVVFLKVDYCKLQEAKGTLRMSYVSQSREVFLPVVKEQGPKGCMNTELPVLIPQDLPADTYKVKFRVTYDVNPLKKGIVSEFLSQEVKIDKLSSTQGPQGPQGVQGPQGIQGQQGIQGTSGN
jgi:hypothetical protein